MYRISKSKYIEHHRTSMKWYEHSMNKYEPWDFLGSFGLPFGTLHAHGSLAREIWTFCRAVCLADSLALCRFAKGPVEIFEVQSIYHVETYTYSYIYIVIYIYIYVYIYKYIHIYIYYVYIYIYVDICL